MKMQPTDEKVILMGRREYTDYDTVHIFHAGAQAKLRFNGTKLYAVMLNVLLWGELSLGIILDGEMKSIPLDSDDNGKEVNITICDNLSLGEHEVIIYKKHAGNQCIEFRSFETDGEFLMPQPYPELKIEVYGDSVCAGEVIEAYDYVARQDPEGHNSKFDNVWNSFVMQTARNLNAQIHNISQGGIALFDKTGYFYMPECIGLETIYDKISYVPNTGYDINKLWDFNNYIADIVIFEFGQNDCHNGIVDANDIDINEISYRHKWKTAYKKLVTFLNEKYNSPKFVLTTTILNHSPEWDDAIEEIKNELLSDGIKVYHNVFKRNGCGTPGHPRLSEHNEMAEELTEFIRKYVLD